jgi:hypothetical protein
MARGLPTYRVKPTHFTLGDLNMSRRFLEVAPGIPRTPCLSGVGAEQVRGGTVAPWPAVGAETLDTKRFSGCRLKLVDEVVAPATILNSARKKVRCTRNSEAYEKRIAETGEDQGYSGDT